MLEALTGINVLDLLKAVPGLQSNGSHTAPNGHQAPIEDHTVTYTSAIATDTPAADSMPVVEPAAAAVPPPSTADQSGEPAKRNKSATRPDEA
jgi:hypothetical protein